MSIEKLEIQNIRGFKNKVFDFDLLPNTANIVVAPNGFGKSSISTAFLCSQGNKLEVKKTDKHLHQEENPSVFRVMADAAWYTADNSKNEISKKFTVKVIKSPVKPKTKMPRINGYAVPQPYLAIDSIELRNVPEKENLEYDAKEFKNELAPNQKVCPNLSSLCDGGAIRPFLLSHLSLIDKLYLKNNEKIFNNLKFYIGAAAGTKNNISAGAEAAFKSAVDASDQLNILMSGILKIEPELSFLDRILICYQLSILKLRNRSNLKKWLEYGNYKDWLKDARDFIADVNRTWALAKIEEKKGKVVVNFPDAGNLSNGQRDLLYFSCSLLKIRDSGSSKPTLLLIDEVFDYLDDANLLVAQYFISNLIEHYRKASNKIYVAIFTHLDPIFFKGYALKKQRITYLEGRSHSITETMKKVILERENAAWKSQLDKYFLHFHIDSCDISSVFNGKFSLPKRHGENKGFYKFLEEEWDKALVNRSDYDPFAVCAYLRVNIERCAYEKLSDGDQKRGFLEVNGTKKKLEYVEELGVPVPEICYLLGGLYNEAMHKKGDLEQSSAVALKIKNIALQNMMRVAVQW